ncbi:4'-phosphopantetheinyl transferase family protein [Krasilnikovia sp. MM14-A1259]|uniref:4'-phosphopantetheinyl transferase family protein n=1 Tax=Krasilnikovia sp. MM14-A1259 TaxID=3373539 RepID=UPI0037FC9BC3
MIESILPTAVAAVDTFVDPPGATLHQEEEPLVSQAVHKRRAEFTTGRWCARQAMARLGRPLIPILSGACGEPQWPAGLVGSITHCAGYRCAVVAETTQVTTVGIDAEPNEPLHHGILAAISVPEEVPRIEALRHDHPDVSWDRLLFSAKESVYKAWFPLTARWLDFQDASLVINPVDGTFNARLRVTGPRVHGRKLSGFAGRWLVDQGLIVTAITIPEPAPAAAAPVEAPAQL